MAKVHTQPVIPIERIASRIYLIRSEKVMFDVDLGCWGSMDRKTGLV
jgi:hypothetical protein